MVALLLSAQPARVRVKAPEFFSAQKFSDVAVFIDSALLRTSEQGKKLNIVDRTHPALVRAVLQKKEKSNSLSFGHITFTCEEFRLTWLPLLQSSFSFLVLRDVLRLERGDAQADGDLQEAGRHHPSSSPVPLRRGEFSRLLKESSLVLLSSGKSAEFQHSFWF